MNDPSTDRPSWPSHSHRPRPVPGACSTTKTSGPGSAGSSGRTNGPIKIGLVTKTDSNPYFVKLRESAKAEAAKHGDSLIALAGKFDGDNAGQVTAIENLVQQGVKGILITPSNSGGVLDAIKKAQDAGVVVIALDTATTPANAVAATYATNNEQAGKLLGQYVKATHGQHDAADRRRWTSTPAPRSASSATTASSRAWACR